MRIKPEHIRAAFQSAIGKGLKFPSVELEEYVADFLTTKIVHYNGLPTK
jgi:hypothetical protein